MLPLLFIFTLVISPGSTTRASKGVVIDYICFQEAVEGIRDRMGDNIQRITETVEVIRERMQ